MPYIFPRRRLKDGDILDPVDLNDDVIPVVEVYAGGLNEHSFVAGGAHGLSTLIDGSIATNAYYSFYEESRVINPHFGSAAPFGMADRTDILSTDKIPNDAGWYALPLNDAGDTEVVVNKGNSVLLVETTVQYGISDEKFRRSNYTAAGVLVPLTGRYLQGKGQGGGFSLRCAWTALWSPGRLRVTPTRTTRAPAGRSPQSRTRSAARMSYSRTRRVRASPVTPTWGCSGRPTSPCASARCCP